MFEITADHIALLNDEKLRDVVARLCEAEVRRRGFSASSVTGGGNQNAPDGGIDVRVALPPGAVIAGFVPRAATGYQVKKQDMPRAEIIAEMCQKGVIRPSIQQLADQGGAYIIVSSDGSTADTPLTSRREAMREAMKGVANGEALALDFYDRTRVATWVRSHEGLIPWVREQVGSAIQGWQSYGSWAYAPELVTAEYLVDEKLRIHPGKRETESGLSPLAGIQQMRAQLRYTRHVVRLVGLSGVGKTRLVQALFDERIGVDSLDPSLAVYTNMADDPDPQPIVLAGDLIAAGTQAILVIDNCTPSLHQRLSELCRRPDSNVSVITVEYDIQDGDHEGTDVFTLDTSSPELIGKLLRQRFPDISPVDVHTIAEFSGGNSRIAIVLAETIGKYGTVAGLPDKLLFQRLFLQGHTPDESLYLTAKACSLVYSFQGEDASEGDGAELALLGKLFGRTPQEMYRGVAELHRRDLVQERGVWRAVLPHALANRFAAAALEEVPYAVIAEHLFTAKSERLMKSFSRRLSYLHASKEAVEIVKKWLTADGLFGSIANLNDLGRAMFENIAPVSPPDSLAALERAMLGPDAEKTAKQFKQHLDLLRSLAYDPALFERCMEAMAKIVTAGEDDERSHGRQLFASLFHLCLSGTRATIDQRLKVIESLLASSDEKGRALGVLALKAMLEAWHFSSATHFSFGAWPRDYGYWPRAREEVQHWFRLVLRLVEELACPDGPISSAARTALAEQFRGLWLRAEVPDELGAVCRAISKQRFWPEGWLAVRETLGLDGKDLDPGRLAALIALEEFLRPADLLQKSRSVVFSTQLRGVDFDDFTGNGTEDFSTRMARTEKLARDLGRAVATEQGTLAELIPEAVRSDGRLWSFGRGLLDGADDARAMWARLVTALTATDEALRKPQALAGFLRELHATNPDLANALLDDAVEHETLSRCYPFLQVALPIDDHGVARLKRSLALGQTPVAMYTHLVYGRATDPIRAEDLKDLVLAIAAIPTGSDVAIEILHARIYSDEDRKESLAPELIAAGRDVMRQYAFAKKNDREDYRLGSIAISCLIGEEGAKAVWEICRKFKGAIEKYETHAFFHNDLINGLISVQPIATLDGLCAGNAKDLGRGIRILQDVGTRRNPLSVVSDADILRWCDEEPATRYPAIACVVPISQSAGGSVPLQWTIIALRLLERAPDPGAVLKGLVSQFMPAGAWGSLAALLETHETLLNALASYPNLAEAVARERVRLLKHIETERRSETAFERQRNERFE